MAWAFDAGQLRQILEAAGFDVTTAATESGGGSITGRRQRGEHATVVSLDAGGRFLATLTDLLETPASTTVELHGVRLRIAPEFSRTTRVAGELTSPDQVGPLLVALPSLAATDGRQPPSREDANPETRGQPPERPLASAAQPPALPPRDPRPRRPRPWWRIRR